MAKDKKYKAKYRIFDDSLRSFLLFQIIRGQATTRALKEIILLKNKNWSEHLRPLKDENLIKETKAEDSERMRLFREFKIDEKAVHNKQIDVFVPDYETLAQKCIEQHHIDTMYSPLYEAFVEPIVEKNKQINATAKKKSEKESGIETLFSSGFEKILALSQDKGSKKRFEKRIGAGENAIVSALKELYGEEKAKSFFALAQNPQYCGIFQSWGLDLDSFPKEKIEVPKIIKDLIKTYFFFGFGLIQSEKNPLELFSNQNPDVSEYMTPMVEEKLLNKTILEKGVLKKIIKKVSSKKKKIVITDIAKGFPTLNEVIQRFPSFLVAIWPEIKDKLTPEEKKTVEKMHFVFSEKYIDLSKPFIEKLKEKKAIE